MRIPAPMLSNAIPSSTAIQRLIQRFRVVMLLQCAHNVGKDVASRWPQQRQYNDDQHQKDWCENDRGFESRPCVPDEGDQILSEAEISLWWGLGFLWRF